MKLSLQKKLNLNEIYKLRDNLIKELSLHINDSITYSQFLEIYKKYGNDLEDKVFAKYYLDIETNKFYELSSGKCKTTSILTKEYVSKDELDKIREKVIESIKNNNKTDISYDELIELHRQYGGKLSLKTFAEETLNVSNHSVDCMKYKKNKRALILRETNIDLEIVEKIKGEIISNSKLHIDDEITLDTFTQLYKQYCFSEDIDKSTFATKVLEISTGQVNRFLSGKLPKTHVFQKYIVSPEYIFDLREYVIQKEKLHIDDSIDNVRFLKLYQKYGGILSKEIFAEEILDISAVGVKNMRVSGANSLILGEIDISEEYVQELRSKMVKKEQLASGQLISKDEFNKMYQKYGGILSKKLFASEILKIQENNFFLLMRGENKTTGILIGEEIIDFNALRRKIIKENFLHHDDKMEYHQFEQLHNKYAPNVPEYIFADKVLDINKSGYARICFNKGVNYTFILSEEKLPKDEEFKVLKNKVLKQEKLHIKDNINYTRFQDIHRKYGGIIPEYIFADRILDISKKKLLDIYNHPGEETWILTKTHFDVDEVKKLHKKIVDENQLYKGKPITYSEFQEWYNKYNHILTPNMFSRLVLGINKQSFKNLKSGYSKTIKALIAPIIWGTKKSEDKYTKLKNKPISKNKVAKIIDNYEYTPQNIVKIKQYIKSCEASYKAKIFDKKDLDLLYDCIEFVQGTSKDIGIFAKIAISFREYEKASKCIATNINNNGINKEEKAKLKELQKGIVHSIKKEKAVQMIMNNEANYEEIANKTGLLEIEVISISKRLLEDRPPNKKNPNSLPENR